MLMWIGISFGGLVGVMLVFLLAYCFVTIVAKRPFEKHRIRRKAMHKSASEDEESGGDAANVGARRSAAHFDDFV